MYQAVQFEIIATWRRPDINSWIRWWKRFSKSSTCFANSADDKCIYCKLSETDSFIPPSLNKSGQIVRSSFDECWTRSEPGSES